MNVNVKSVFLTAKHVVPVMERQGNGVILITTSVAAFIGFPAHALYCASKAALDNMTKSLARALAPKIRVVSVSPALVDTEFVKSLDQVWHDEQAARTPMGRLATPDEIGNAVRAVIDTLTFSTGCIIQVDGGRTLCS